MNILMLEEVHTPLCNITRYCNDFILGDLSSDEKLEFKNKYHEAETNLDLFHFKKERIKLFKEFGISQKMREADFSTFQCNCKKKG